jgi:predicted phosphodiesterase
MHLLLLADTHVPRRARTLPEPVWHEVERADLVVHAGDWVTTGLLDKLERRSKQLLQSALAASALNPAHLEVREGGTKQPAASQ